MPGRGEQDPVGAECVRPLDLGLVHPRQGRAEDQGDVRGVAAGSAPDGVLQPEETEVDQPFLLWSCGPDDKFGPDADFAGGGNLDDRDATVCDDVTNFR